MSDQLEFTIEIPEEDRSKLLRATAGELATLKQHLGGGEPATSTSGSALLQAIMDDAVILPPAPVMHRISNEEFLAKGFDLPVDIRQIAQTHNFYWLQVPVGVFPKEDWGYNRIEVGIVMDTKPGQDIPRAFRIMPEKEFQDLVNFNASGQVGLDANFNFAGQTADYHFDYNGNKVDLSAGAKAAGDFKNKLVFGPLSYKIRRVKVDHNGKNTHVVKWVLNDAQTIQDGFDLVVIAQVPKTYKDFGVYAEVRARKSLYDVPGLLDLMKFLSDKARLILKTGCPTKDSRQWDLSMYL